jgi:RNA-directed DNA polymerase
MKIPDQTTRPIRDLGLCFEVRKLENLWSAWSSVRRRALSSRDVETQRDARDIDQNPSKAIRSLHEALRNGTFRFAAQRGVVKVRKGKTPRPIVVSPVRNRIVQRAILDVLQSDKQRIRARLGNVPKVLGTPTSVGGIPGRGSPEAVALARSSIAGGAKFFIRSDIRDFFTKVPTPRLLSYLREQTGDDEFVQFIEDGLKVELSNSEEPKVRQWLSLFPDAEMGVPQGSSLSALCANVVLRDFDHELNRRGVQMVRYIDDFVILGATEHNVQKAWMAGEALLNSLGLEAHKPVANGEKASLGSIHQGFDFLSFRFHGAHVSPSRKAKQDVLKAVSTEFLETRNAIQAIKNDPRRAQPMFIQALATVDRRIRGWGDAFRDSDQRLEFAQLDQQLYELVGRFEKWYLAQTRTFTPQRRMRTLGVALLADTPLLSQDKC